MPGVKMSAGLPERIEGLYDRLKDFPEARHTEQGTFLKPDAWLALLDLRQELEREVIAALYRLRDLEQ